MNSTKVDELKCDVDELNRLLSIATRPKVKDILSLELRKVQTEILRLQEQSNDTVQVKPSAIPVQQNKCYEVKLDSYAWDESEKFVKIFVTLKNVHLLPTENVYTSFTDNSMELHVNGLENRNYTLPIKNLSEKIDVTKSTWRVKSDMVVVSLAKVKTDITWKQLVACGKKANDQKSLPKVDTGSDPTAGLMDLMKQMYDDGDDEMKRTIAKAWSESRNNPGMPSF